MNIVQKLKPTLKLEKINTLLIQLLLKVLGLLPYILTKFIKRLQYNTNDTKIHEVGHRLKVEKNHYNKTQISCPYKNRWDSVQERGELTEEVKN